MSHPPRYLTWILGLLVSVSSVYANDWGSLATVSSTMGIQGSRLCIGETTRGDIGCPSYAPSLTSAGHISVTGNLSAAKFIGDGSNLTGLPQPTTATDRISTTGVTSGATLGMAVADRGTVSFTLAGTPGAAYLHATAGLVGPAVSTTTGNIQALRILNSITGETAGTPGYTWSGDTNTGMYWVSADQLGLSTGGAQRALVNSAGLTVTGYVSTTGIIDAGSSIYGYAGDSATAPGYTWSGDNNTGMYWVSADQLGLATGGVQRALVNNAGITVTGYVSTSGIIDAGSYIYGYPGDSAAAPGYTWSGDNNTGMFNAAADIIGFATGGAERARITSAGISTTGNIYLNSGGSIVADSADTTYNASLALYGGTANANTGATMALYGIDHATASGRIYMYAVSDTVGTLLYRFYSRTTAGTNSALLSLYQGGNATLAGTMTAAAFVGDGSGLTGVPNSAITLTGNVTGSGTGSIATTIAANAVTTARIADNAVTSAKIATNAVTAVELASNSVSSTHIIDGSILAADIADNAVTTAKINTAAVTANELATNAVTAIKIADGNVTLAKMASNSVDSDNIVNGSILAADISTSAITAIKIADNAVTTAKINTGAVTANELATNAITTIKIADSAVTLPKIQNIATNRLLGRGTAGTGNVEQITIGSGLDLTGTTLTATAGGECTINYSRPSLCGSAPACPANYTSLYIESGSKCGGSDSSENTQIRHCLRVRC